MKTIAILAVLLLALGIGQASAFAWAEIGDAGELPGTAQGPVGAGDLTSITGSHGATDADMYMIHIYNPAIFSATTVGGASYDTQLWLFDLAGHGVSFNDDSVGLQSSLTGSLVPGAGHYYLAISCFDYDAADSGGNQIWNDAPFGAERAPDGPGAANPIHHWIGTATSGGGNYAITLSGTHGVAAPIPEPATFALFGLGLGVTALGVIRRRRNAK